jgi:hypothetical protein
VFLWEETAMINAAKQVKAARPNASVIVWLDSVQIYTGWVFPWNLTHCEHCSPDPAHPGTLINHTFNADVFAVQGHSRAAEYMEQRRELLLHNSSGQPALGWGGLHIYDFSQAQVQRFWTDTCLNLTASGVIDGCGADFSDKDAASKANVAPNVAKSWMNGHTKMLKDTTLALGDGLLVGKDFDQLENGTFNAILREGCTASNETVNEFRALALVAKSHGQRLVAQCHFGHPEYPPPLNATIAEDTAAAFLCGAGDDHYFTTSGWRTKASADFDHGNFSSHWLPSIMGRPLGAPLAEAKYDAAKGEWSRSFASGTRVAFNAVSNRGSIAWARGNGYR